MTSSCPSSEWITVKASSPRNGAAQLKSKRSMYTNKLKSTRHTEDTQTLSSFYSHATKQTITATHQDSNTKDNGYHESELIIIQTLYEKIIQSIMSLVAYQQWKPITNHEKIFDLQTIIHILQTIASQTSHTSHGHTTQNQHEQVSSDDIDGFIESLLSSKNLFHEIVCYGVGNFYACDTDTSYSTMNSSPFFSSSSSSSSILQLACSLLLRHALAASRDNDVNTHSRIDDDSNKKITNESSYPSSNHLIFNTMTFQKDQQALKMVYFDPRIHPIEKRILNDYLHIDIISYNEMGKRCINTTNPLSTLFFMPHCPMRLYSNVLWANWNTLDNGKFILMGNSFHAYDQRIIDSTVRRDTTNCIFPLLPHVQEESILSPKKNNQTRSTNSIPYGRLVLDPKDDSMYFSYTEMEEDLEKAFHDCSIMYFQRKMVGKDHDDDACRMISEYLKRPDEYHSSKVSEEDEGYQDELL